ncbi:MAG: DUF342 domain-containing protein [Chitinivibrionales bacterium]|nr:DUF342 domain-containing protein [Chitinivibrionales bacterium]
MHDEFTPLLLVEDNPDDTLLLQETLNDCLTARFSVTCCETLREASTYLDHQSAIAPQLIITDLNLPDSTGLNTYETLHSIKPNLPIILLTGLSDERVAIEAMRRGAQDYLVKGEFGHRQIERSILYAIERIKVSDELRKNKEIAEEANRQIFAELQLAREIQQGLYPRTIPGMDGLEIAAALFQAHHVGGDYYDIIPINDHEMALIIVDVAGHDIGSAFVVGMAKVSFQAHIPVYSSLIEIFNHVNEDMVRVLRNSRYLSAFLAILNTHTGLLRYAKAGMSNQYLFRSASGSIEQLSTKGNFIGSSVDGKFEEKKTLIEINDKVVLFTDGFFENTNRSDEPFGEKRLQEQLCLLGHQRTDLVHKKLLAIQQNFCLGKPPDDDLCMVVVGRTERSFTKPMLQFIPLHQLTMQPVLIQTERIAQETLSRVLTALDSNGYSDGLIRHYKKILKEILQQLSLKQSDKECPVRFCGQIQSDSFHLYFFILAERSEISFCLASDPVASVLKHLNPLFGTYALNEDGSRLTLSYTQANTALQQAAEVTFQQHDDGASIFVPSSVDPYTTLDSLVNILIGQDIVNFDRNAIAEALRLRLPKGQRIGERWRYFDKKKLSLFTLDQNPLQAVLTLQPASDPALRLTAEDLSFILAKQGIAYGIQTETIAQIATAPVVGTRYCIAHALAAVPGKDAVIKELLSIPVIDQGLIRLDGSIDDTQTGNLLRVKAGTVLIEKTAAVCGVAGMSIYVRTIDPPAGMDADLSAGFNTGISEDGLKLMALTDGFVCRENGRINVYRFLFINGPVDYSTGNIESQDDILIAGTVAAGFTVSSAKNITIAGNIDAASVRASGTIFCRGGISGRKRSVITAAGSIWSDFCQNVTIESGKDLHIRQKLTDCTVTCKGNIFIGTESEGFLSGGTIVCNGSIRCAQIGGGGSGTTLITIAVKNNDHLLRRISLASAKEKQVQDELTKIKNMLRYKSKLFRLKTQKTKADKDEIEKLLQLFNTMRLQSENIKQALHKLKAAQTKGNSLGIITASKALLPTLIVRFGVIEKTLTGQRGPSTIMLVDDRVEVQ